MNNLVLHLAQVQRQSNTWLCTDLCLSRQLPRDTLQPCGPALTLTIFTIITLLLLFFKQLLNCNSYEMLQHVHGFL